MGTEHMSTEIIFNRVGEPWAKEEDAQLNELYNEQLLDIMEISKIHSRAPGGIISRLLKHNYIDKRISARGYTDYKNNNLYKEIVTRNKQSRKERKKLKEKQIIEINSEQNEDILIRNKSDYNQLYNEVKEIKNELNEIKKTINELVDLLK